MKKLLSVITSILFMLALTSCGSAIQNIETHKESSSKHMDRVENHHKTKDKVENSQSQEVRKREPSAYDDSLSSLNPDNIVMLSLKNQINIVDVIHTCRISKGYKPAMDLYDSQLSCLRTLADGGNMIPMFELAHIDMSIYDLTENEDALSESVLYLKAIIAFSRRREFGAWRTSRRRLRQLIKIVNKASQLLFKNKNNQEAQDLLDEIKILASHMTVE